MVVNFLINEYPIDNTNAITGDNNNLEPMQVIDMVMMPWKKLKRIQVAYLKSVEEKMSNVAYHSPKHGYRRGVFSGGS
jgi:hypothetical protein